MLNKRREEIAMRGTTEKQGGRQSGEGAVVRLKWVEMENVRCVCHGEAGMGLKSSGPAGAELLGVYGASGTGKSTLVEAAALLKSILSGRTIPARFAWMPRTGTDGARLQYTLSVERGEARYTILYQCSLRREPGEQAETWKAVLEDEILSWSLAGEEKYKMCPVVDTRTSEVFLPASRREILVGKGRQDSLMAARQSAAAASRSFVFSGELLRAVRGRCAREEYRFPLEALVRYGTEDLLVLDSARAGIVSLGAFLRPQDPADVPRTMPGLSLPMSSPVLVLPSVRDAAREAVRRMNPLLAALSHGRTIGLEEISTGVLADGTVGHRVQLVVQENGQTLPLRLASDGFRRLVALAPLLAAVWRRPSVTAVVDGLDEGLFEPLLGELLRRLAREGRGQLIFTSSTLRTLETLDRGHAVFTTENPDRRYLRLIGVKSNNNLRDLYYRVLLGGRQSEPLWMPPDWEQVQKSMEEPDPAEF